MRIPLAMQQSQFFSHSWMLRLLYVDVVAVVAAVAAVVAVVLVAVAVLAIVIEAAEPIFAK